MATSSLSELNARRQFATKTLTQLAARNAVKRQIQREGRIKPWWLVSPAQIASLRMTTSPLTQSFMFKPPLRPLCRTYNFRTNAGGPEINHFRCAEVMNEMEAAVSELLVLDASQRSARINEPKLLREGPPGRPWSRLPGPTT